MTKQPEYETVWAHGGNCGIDDLDAIARLDRMDDDFGLDTIEMGATVAVAMDAGLAKFGDAQAAIDLVKQVGQGTPLGRMLGSGAAVTGQGLRGRARARGQGPGHAGLRPARDPGHRRDLRHHHHGGGPHRRLRRHATNILKVGGDVDPLTPEGQVELSRNLQIATAAIDSTGMCLFIAFAIRDQPETFQALLDMLNAFTVSA